MKIINISELEKFPKDIIEYDSNGFPSSVTKAKFSYVILGQRQDEILVNINGDQTQFNKSKIKFTDTDSFTGFLNIDTGNELTSEDVNKLSLLPYQVLRVNNYPSIQEQLDTIFHQGIEVWKEQIQAVKDKYPKP